MRALDVPVLALLNHLAHKSWLFDTVIVRINTIELLKGGAFLALVWWQWFREDEQRHERREILLSAVAASLVALLVSRVMAVLFPFSERPLRNPALHFQVPYSMAMTALTDWSSFPSDHAALFFTLATGVLLVSRPAGLFAVTYAVLIGGLTRIYVGLHYPSDILVGALIGVTMANLFAVRSIRGLLARPAFRWLDRHPESFYAAAFIATYQMATLFAELRTLGGSVVHLLLKP